MSKSFKVGIAALLLLACWPALAQSYPVDVYIDFEAGSNGDVVTASNIHAYNTDSGTFTCGGTASAKMTISTAAARPPHGPITVGANTYNGAGTRGVAFDAQGTNEGPYCRYNFAAAHSVISYGGYYRTSALDNDNLSVVFGIQGYTSQYGSNFNVAHWDGVGHGLRIASGGGGTIPLQANTTYWVTGLYDASSSTAQHKLAVFETTNWTLVGSTSITTFNTSPANLFTFGISGADPQPATGVRYWDDFVVKYDGTFPLLPGGTLPGASLFGQITFQELLPYTGTSYPAGQNRSAYPASMSFPLASGDAPASWWGTDGTPSATSQLGLTTASVGQFRCLAWHKDGSCKFVLVDTEVTNNFASTAQYTGIALTLSGSGNFGGSSLAVNNSKLLSDNSACEPAGTSANYACVDTGAIRAQIKKSGFSGLDKVVGSDGTVFVDGGSDGLVVRGPSVNHAMPVPDAAVAQAVGGGSYTASATLYVKVACVGLSGEGAASSATSVAVGSGQLLRVNKPVCDAASDPAGNFVVYAGTSNSQGSLHLQTPQPVSAAWTEPTTCPFAGYGCISGRGVTNYLRGAPLYAGQSDGCGDCTVDYKTALDTASTAVIEENGPAKAVIRVKAAATDGTTNYLKEDTKFVFYKDSTVVRQPVLLKNADDPCPTASSATDACYNSTHFASDYKGFSAHELRVKPAFAVTGFTSATDTTPVSVTLDGAHDAYLYQGYSSLHQLPESDATAYCTGVSVGCAFPEILRYPTMSANAYTQRGYLVQANGAAQTSNVAGGGSGMGWADFTGSSGQGIQVGFWSMATEWPKAIQAKYTGSAYEIRAGILPDQTLFDAATAQPYYIAWPQYRVADILYNFHSSALADANGDFLKAQYYLVGRASVDAYLVGRASVDAYNRAHAFGKVYPLLDATAADNYMKNAGAYCPTAGSCVPDYVAKARRAYSWTQAAEGNQNDWDWEFVQQFAERGLTGRLLYALYDARYFMTQELPRADGFKWRDRPVGTLTSFGFPDTPANGGKYMAGNAPLANRNWNTDPSHAHFYGGPQFTYYLTGDSFLKDALDQAWGDYALNPNIIKVAQGGASGQGFGQSRGVGQQITHRAHYYDYAVSQKQSADASQALAIASTILNTQMPLTLQARGFGSNVKGVSPSTGFPALAEGDVTPDRTDGPKAAVNISQIACVGPGVTMTLASPLPFDSPNTWGAPEVVRITGSPVRNGDVTLSAASSDRTSLSYVTPVCTNCTGSCGTVNIPGKCPADANGDCSGARYRTTFMGPLITQGLVELASFTESTTTDPNAVWADHTLAYDTALGILRSELYETMLPAGGGALYYDYLDYSNGDKHYALHPAWANVAYSNYGLWWALTGTVAPAEKTAFDAYLAGKWASGTSWEYGSNLAEVGLAHMTGFPLASAPSLVAATHTDACVASDGDSTSPHCHLTVTVPAGATRYRIKGRGDGKAILDSLEFDNRTDPKSDGSGCAGKFWDGTSRAGCYGQNPAQNWPFFSSTEVGNLPVPSGTTQDIVVTSANFSGFNASDLTKNKFAVKAITGGTSPVVAAPTIFRGTCKGCVIR